MIPDDQRMSFQETTKKNLTWMMITIQNLELVMTMVLVIVVACTGGCVETTWAQYGTVIDKVKDKQDEKRIGRESEYVMACDGKQD